MSKEIWYSEKYSDDIYEYRHVILPKDMKNVISKENLMTETEWRNLGVQQSTGWIHYMIHQPEPHVLLFRRPRSDINMNKVSFEGCSHIAKAVAVNN